MDLQSWEKTAEYKDRSAKLKVAVLATFHKDLKQNQLRAAMSIEYGHDVFLIAATAWGKSLVFQSPLLLQPKKFCIVVSPLLDIMSE